MASTKKAADKKKRKAAPKAAARAESAAAKRSEHSQPPAAADAATVDRRAAKDRRNKADRRKRNEPVAVERRTFQRRTKVNRRRQIDPTTCERDYSADEIEFMSALEQYKRTSGRMFPTCSEILEVLTKLGYRKQPVEPAGEAPASAMEPERRPVAAPSAAADESWSVAMSATE